MERFVFECYWTKCSKKFAKAQKNAFRILARDPRLAAVTLIGGTAVAAASQLSSSLVTADTPWKLVGFETFGCSLVTADTPWRLVGCSAASSS